MGFWFVGQGPMGRPDRRSAQSGTTPMSQPVIPPSVVTEEWMRPDLRQSDHGIPVMFHLLRRFIRVFVAISMPQKSKHPVF